jgi:isoleucyl-tRNA synthetase
MNYKETLNLPTTKFPMKANLPQKEQRILAFWNEHGIYERILQSRDKHKPYILHDGPPYANGHIHMGTGFNKILKDFAVKCFSMQGYYAPYVPGWDCHGMPIEHNVMLELRKTGQNLDKMDIRKRCRAYASKYIKVQRKEFPRLGVLGDWNNPYLTMDPIYEATIIEGFRVIAKNGYIYRGLRPIHWCPRCKTALAEAEVEYGMHTSPSIYIKFPIPDYDKERKTSFIIWTTTPWTLPANVAVAVHPKETYVVFTWEKEAYIVAEPLFDKVRAMLNIDERKILKKVKGEEFEGLEAQHPIFDEKKSVTILADFVDMETGTGVVHTAPGHGYEDYQIGLVYDLPIVSPVDNEGKFTDEVPFAEGKLVFEANKDVLSLLKKKGILLHTTTVEHSYPHCWRCSNPLIFRATEQWFLKIDHDNLRERLLKAIEASKWIPEWSKDRIYNMVESRPDWTLSRQRAWGVPIPALYCNSCGTSILDDGVMKKAVAIIEEKNADSWFTEPVDHFLPDDFRCPNCKGTEFTKEQDIFDVWFDSSMSHKAVLEERDELSKPCDLYLEAVDQHRGWFQLSLIVSKTIDDTIPFKTVLTHGLVLDANLKKMSKKLGNIISPEDICEKHGADILRLWFASIDYTSDITFGFELLDTTIDMYRKIRNTFRFLQGNLYDFDPQEHTVAYEGLLPMDQLMLSKLTRLIKEIIEDYRNYRFNRVTHAFHNFCTTELSHYYFDIMKDRLYTHGKDSPERRSTQTVFFTIQRSLLLLIAPILAFTAEEIWQLSPHFSKESESIHMATFPEPDEYWLSSELGQRFYKLRGLREVVYRALEKRRQDKFIGNALESKVIVSCKNSEIREFLEKPPINLTEYFIVSGVELAEYDAGETYDDEDDLIAVRVEKADGSKCMRCWVFSDTVGTFADHPTICKKCYDTLKEGR